MKNSYIWVVLILFGISTLVVFGVLIQAIADKKGRKRFPSPGHIFYNNGKKIHANYQGQGTPTVILEAGLSCTHIDWCYVMPEVAKITRVFSYDRGGYGWSDKCSKPRNGLKMVNELHALLLKAEISGPYIVVGHSYGGLLVRLFASRYPEEVIGIILVDGSPEDQKKFFPKPKLIPRIVQEIQWQIYRLRPILARIGLTRLGKKPNGNINSFPVEIRPMAIEMGLQSGAYDWTWTEVSSIDITCEEVRNSILPSHIQSTVLVAGNSIAIEEYQKIWLTLQYEQSQKLPNATFQVVENSGHSIHLEQPEKVIDAIMKMVDESRHFEEK